MLRITRVEPILIAVPYDCGGPKLHGIFGPDDRMSTLLVRVDTDAGITGWGEAFGLGFSPITFTALAHLIGPQCVGRDAEDVAGVMDALRRRTYYMGTTGPARFALSGIEIALWDIVGQARNVALSELFGGARRNRIPTYASLLPYGTRELLERNLHAAIDRGYRHIKLHGHDPELVVAARAAVGPEPTLMLDTNCAWTLAEAQVAAGRMEGCALAWLEEPLYPQNDYAALAALRAGTAIPIAAGENVETPDDVRRIAELGALDILQPDVSKIGGPTEMRAAIANAQAGGMGVQPHSPFFGPTLIATLHLLATLDDDALCERFYCDVEACAVGEAVEVRDGFLTVPAGPGLGVAVDEAVIKRYRVA
jgi:L-alanine-DL-glutamate epimerase-like enolase superfamily enzyme